MESKGDEIREFNDCTRAILDLVGIEDIERGYFLFKVQTCSNNPAMVFMIFGGVRDEYMFFDNGVWVILIFLIFLIHDIIADEGIKKRMFWVICLDEDDIAIF